MSIKPFSVITIAYFVFLTSSEDREQLMTITQYRKPTPFIKTLFLLN